MCGIVASRAGATRPLILEALKRLEYPRYSMIPPASPLWWGAQIERRRRARQALENWKPCLKDQPLPGRTGIGHTRWANPRRAHRKQRRIPRPRRAWPWS